MITHFYHTVVPVGLVLSLGQYVMAENNLQQSKAAKQQQ